MGSGQRHLAAILAADVAGYSRLMAVDEDGTLARLKLLRVDHFEPAIREHGGRLVGEAGDSLLVDFGAATSAVTCALEVQEKLARLNADLPEDQRMAFRMGINLGEVIADGQTIYGDGVNIAARLEKLAKPGGVVVARAVFDQVKGRLAYSFEDLGEQTLHNIAEPIRAYRVTPLGLAANKGPAPAASNARTSIAVLPFANMSGDPEQEYFADGMTEDLITALAKFRDLSVAARNSTFAFKGKAVNVQEAAQQLGVRYVVEGSVRKGGNRVRVTAQLIDASTGSHLWAERYDRTFDDVFDLQDELVTAMTAQLPFALSEAAAETRNSAPPANLTAYDHFLRFRTAWRRGDEREAFAHVLKAVEADPGFAVALAYAGFLHIYAVFSGNSDLSPKELKARARSFVERAAAAASGDYWVHQAVGMTFNELGEFDRAKRHFDLAATFNPHFILTSLNRAILRSRMGEHAEAIEDFERVFWLEPRLPPTMREALVELLYRARLYDRAIQVFGEFDQPQPYLLALVAACHAQAGRPSEAAEYKALFDTRRPEGLDVSALADALARINRLPDDKEHWLDGFRKASLLA